jgi:NTE family protein
VRDARRTTYLLGLAALLLFGGPAAYAQTYPNGLSADSVDPRADAVTIREIRQQLNRVRNSQKRPIVGVVLSGGGAKGAAEVGALKYIEELGIPIDFVCGTSIGGLVGGFYALGYRADDLEELFRNQDWGVMLTDRVAPEYIPYSTKMARATYLLSFPFHYPAGQPEKVEYRFRDRVRKQIEDRNTTRAGAASLVNSLPSGYAYGFNVNNLLSSMSVGFQDSISFARLPMPYVCVAGDMVSSKAKNWGSGSITTAMRSTMSIPGLFDPVRTGRMVLVDGGVRNNFPADIARAVGVDYLIGIELSDARPDYEEINNIGDILGQFITMLGTDSFNKNIGKCDVFIKPDLGEYNMLSFNREAVDSMLQRGYNAAAAQRDGLLSVRAKLGKNAKPASAKRATDIATHPVTLCSIEYDGLSDADSRRVARMTELDITQPLDKATIDAAMSRLQASGAFETVTYSLYGAHEPYRLVFHCTPAPVHSFGLGLRADSMDGASLLVGVGLNTHRLSGSKVDLRARIGQNFKLSAHYALDLNDLPTLNVTASFARYRGQLGAYDDRLKYDISYLTHREDFFISGLNWTRMDIRAGIAHKAYYLSPNSPFARSLQEQGVSLSSNYIGSYLQGILYTFDNAYFPQRGLSLRLRADYDFIQPGVTAFTPVLTTGVDVRVAIPLGGNWTLLPDVRLRGISHFGEEAVDGLFHTNFAGGSLAARYTEDQLPFFGENTLLATGDYLINTVLEARWNPLGNLYVSAMAGALQHDNGIGSLVRDLRPDVWALGLEAAYDTFAGPVKFNIHWSNIHKWGAYLSLGFDF